MSNINVNTITPLAGTSGTVNVSGSLKVSGSVTANGNIILGDSTADSVSLGAEVSSSIVPDATATYNLGSNAKKWNKVHAISGSFLHISGATNFSNNVTVTGSVTISGSSTLTNFGNFRNRLTNDLRAFEVSTDPTVPGGFREGLATPHTGSEPHLHFMLSGSGHAGVGLLNPRHTLHISTSDGGTNKVALFVDGKSHFGSTISSSLMPDAGGTYSLGSMAQSWKNIHAHGLGHIHTASINVVSSSLTPDATSTYNIGSITKRWLSGSFVHVSASTISASGYIYAAGNLDIDGSTILGNQTSSDTHLITGKSITFDGPITASSTVTHISGANGNILGFNSGSFNYLETTGNVSSSGDIMVGTGNFILVDTISGSNARDLNIHSNKSINISSTENAANAINIDTTAGSIDINSGDNITVNAADDITIAGDDITITSNGTNTIQTNSQILDINVNEFMYVDCSHLRIQTDTDGAPSFIKHRATGANSDFLISLSGVSDSSLVLQSSGTAADALQIKSDGGGMDISVAGAGAGEDLDITCNQEINVTSTSNAANAIYLRANGGTSETIKIHSDQGTGAGSIELTSDAGSIDINAGDDITIDAADNLTMQSADTMEIKTTSDDGSLILRAGDENGIAFYVDANATAASEVKIEAGIFNLDVLDKVTVDAADEIELTTTTADGHISLVSAHTAGVAIHLDGNANAGSIVDIDAGILDIDVTGAATITTAAGSGTLVTGGLQNHRIDVTATDDGTGTGTIPNMASVVQVNADSDANHIVILPAAVIGRVVIIIENGTTGYELRSATPGSISINGGTGSGAESAIAGAVSYIKCVAISSTAWICSQYAADGTESKVEAAA